MGEPPSPGPPASPTSDNPAQSGDEIAKHPHRHPPIREPETYPIDNPIPSDSLADRVYAQIKEDRTSLARYLSELKSERKGDGDEIKIILLEGNIDHMHRRIKSYEAQYKAAVEEENAESERAFKRRKRAREDDTRRREEAIRRRLDEDDARRQREDPDYVRCAQQ